MSFVERLFPASELAAMKHAVLAASDEPAAKRRKVERRQSSIRSTYSTDSGYNSDESSYSKAAVPSLVQQQSVFSMTAASDSPASSHSDEDDFCSKIAEARARLYSNASLSIPSPPPSHKADSPVAASQGIEEYPSPVSVETLAETASSSGCNLDTFVRLGLAVTSHERSLLSTLSPVPKAMPIYATAEMQARKLQWLQRRKAAFLRQQAELEQQRRSSYQGFAISSHDDEDDEEDDEEDEDTREQQKVEDAEQYYPGPNSFEAGPEMLPGGRSELQHFDDWFNIEAASEQEEEGSRGS